MSDEYDDMALEAERYAALVSEMQGVDENLLRYGLNHDYDVIVSEALDCIISIGKVDDFIDQIINLYNDEQSYIVSGRLIICSALFHDDEMKKSVDKLNYDRRDKYFQAWENAAEYISSGDSEALRRIKLLADVPDRTVASVSNSLLEFLKMGEWK